MIDYRRSAGEVSAICEANAERSAGVTVSDVFAALGVIPAEWTYAEMWRALAGFFARLEEADDGR